MSLSKECDQVSSSTSGYPIVTTPLYPAVLRADDSDLIRFERKYFQFNKDRVQFTTDRVQSLFALQVDLEKQQALNMIQLENALAAQVEAECTWRSSFLPAFPVLSYADITSVLGQELSALGDLSLLQPPATTQSATTTAATTTTTAAVRSTTTIPALPSTAANAVRKPKLTVLPLRFPNGSGFTAATMNRPIKPGKRFNARPVCRKPSKRAAPSTTAEDDLPASTST